MFPGPSATVYCNEEGEVIGWDYYHDPDPADMVDDFYDDYDDYDEDDEGF